MTRLWGSASTTALRTTALRTVALVDAAYEAARTGVALDPAKFLA
jgi:hypothetical protein